MCFSSGSSKPPPPAQPNKFVNLPQSESDVGRQAAIYQTRGYTNTATYGSELGSGGAAPAAAPAPAAASPGGV